MTTELQNTVQEIKESIVKAIQKYQDIITENQETIVNLTDVIEEQKGQIKAQENIIKELRAQLYDKPTTTTTKIKNWLSW
jgi:predicted  nucleic acid-binding Zn-ribbon protein